MGACFSSDKTAAADDFDSSSSSSSSSAAAAASPPSAQVISIHGELHQYTLPVFVSQVLKSEQDSNNSSNSSIFLCNSDSLCYDEFIPPLDFNHQLHPNQIYFVLPLSKLQTPFSSKDMAALAVKASVAIQNAAKKDGRRNKARISPLLLLSNSDQSGGGGGSGPDHTEPVKTKPSGSLGSSQGGLPRSGSVRKFQRYSSRRAKLAVRSFRLKLSTIYEGSVM